MPRILCARFPHLGLLAAWRRHPELRAEPVVVGGAPELRLPVVAASVAARAAGVRPGQPLREAQQRCPAAVFVALDEGEVERLREAAIAALCTVSPAVEVGDEEAFADLSGSHALHPTEPAWAVAVARALAGALGETPAAGVAGSRLVAGIAAQLGTPGHARRVRDGEEAAFLAPQPLHLLPGDRAVLARLATLGLDCAGAVASLAVADMQRQFGPAGLLVHRLARGDDGEGVHAWTPPRVLAERLALDGAVADLEALRLAARRLADGIGARLQAGGLAAARVDLHVEEEGSGGAAAISRVLPAAAGSAAELWPAVLGMLGEARPQRPVAALRLVAGRLQAGGGRQSDMWHGGDAGEDAVLRQAMSLHDRFGRDTLFQARLVFDPGDVPERRNALDRPGSAPPAAPPLRPAAARP